MAAALLIKAKLRLDLWSTNYVKTLNNAALIASHVVGSTSHASFFIQLQKFLIQFTSGDCGEHSSFCLSLFLNHANTAMTLWQRAFVAGPYYICSSGCSKFPSMRSM